MIPTTSITIWFTARRRITAEIAFPKRLVPATQIVLIGSGTGKSSAVEALVEYLKMHRPDIFRRVMATEIVDLSALTEPGIEAIAKQHMNSVD
jgi:predicted AAA+ superfamily ATPase